MNNNLWEMDNKYQGNPKISKDIRELIIKVTQVILNVTKKQNEYFEACLEPQE